MLGFAWLSIRQAQEALKNGRLEEAHRLLCQPAAQGHKRSWELLQQVGQKLVERGEWHLRHDDPAVAWNDLVAAEQVGALGNAAFRLRQNLARLGVAEVRALLEAGEPGRAAEVLVQLRNRSVVQPELQLLEDAAKTWGQAREQAARGEFAQALHTVERFTRADDKHIAYEITLEDSRAFTKPWKNTRTFTLRPDWEIMEYSCEENNKDLYEGHIKAPPAP